MSDIMFAAASHVDELINPLKRIGIDFFSLTRVFKNQAVIDFNNNPKMADRFYYSEDKFYEDYMPERIPFSLGSDISFLSNIQDNRTVAFLREECDIDNMCVI